MSWFSLPSGRYFYSIAKFIYEITEPFLALFRRIMPSVMVGGAGIDFSPIVAILVLRLLHTLVLQILNIMAGQLMFAYF